MPKLIGILGGMGPAATLDLQQKILAATPARRDQDHIPTVVWNVPQIPDRLTAILEGTESPVPAMVSAARSLERAGAAAIAMPCNTAHHWADDIRASVGIPLLHIADAVLDYLPPDEQGPVCLLATPVTLKSGFYQQRFNARGVEVLVPDQSDLDNLMVAIRQVKAGHAAAARAPFIAIARKQLERGARYLLLACTELPLLSPGSAIEAQCVDPTAALARACIQFALSEESRGAQLA